MQRGRRYQLQRFLGHSHIPEGFWQFQVAAQLGYSIRRRQSRVFIGHTTGFDPHGFGHHGQPRSAGIHVEPHGVGKQD